MRSFGITRRTVITLLVIAGIAAALVFAVMRLLDRWTEEIVNSNTELTQRSVGMILTASRPVMDSLWNAGFFQRKELSKRDWRVIDSLISIVTASQINTIAGMEGGFYLLNFDDMIGYSWPTSPPPAPAYGPAPRSYPIIKEQIKRTLTYGSMLIEFHTFDFAIFPLASVPLTVHGTVVGAAWARIHVERQLPSNRLAEFLNIAAIIAIGALGATLFLLMIRKRHIDAIRRGLDQLRRDPSHRLEERPGVYGIIAGSINTMVEARALEQRRSAQLEKELHQQDKLATLGKLIAGVSHEVKTPLAIIKTRIQMWQRDLIELGGTAPADRIVSKDSMELVIREIDRLSRLVKRLLVFSKPVVTTMQKTDINSLIAQTLTFLSAGLHEKDIRITTECDPALSPLLIDPQGIEQVLLNVLMNSIDALNDGGAIAIATRPVDGGSSVEIIIRDTGEGFAPGTAGKVFDPFFTTKQQGVGLGLSISHEIVKAHGGAIEFLPSPERGTICRILLPNRASA